MEEPYQAVIDYVSVSDLAGLFNEVLVHAFPEVHFKGEISQITRASSGHVYFTIKDEKSQLAAVMWRGVAGQIGFVPVQGMEVLCSGRPNIYSGSGKFQVVVHRMAQSGEGALQKRFLELKAKLEREGLFDESRKRPIPFFPRSIGIVTSKSGAAIHDIMTKIQERMPIVPVYLFDARVQGQGAAQEIVSGIEYFNLEFPVDVLIIGRGGGSLEDLWCFNEEIVARAVFASRVPVISGVGHEVDVSLADLAADRRAPTPTAAGEMVVPSRQDLLERLSNLHKRLSNIDQWFASRVQGVDEFEFRLTAGYQRYLGEVRHRLERVRGDLNAIRPDRLFAQLIGRLDVLAARFSSLRDQVITRRVEVLSGLHQRLERSSPQRAIALHLERVLYAEERLRRVVRDSIQERTSRLLQLEGKLAVLNPASVLQRGFALVQAKDGKIIRFASDAQLGTDLNVRFTDGEIEVRVAKVSGAGRESSGRDSHHEDDQGVVTSKNAQRDLF